MFYEELEAINEDLNTSITSLKEGIDNFPNIATNLQHDEIKRLQEMMRTLKSYLAGFRAELADISGAADRSKYQSIYNEHSTTIANLANDLQWMMNSTIKSGLVGNDAQGGVVQYNDKQLIQAAMNLNADSIDKLDGAISDLTDVQHIGDAAAQTLASDREKLMAIDSDLSTMQNDLALTKQKIREISRRFATDRIVQILIILTVLLAVGLILYKFLK